MLLSATAEADLDLAAPPARRPGTAIRFLLFLLAAGGSAVVLAVGFPPGAPDRLPVLLLAFALALDAVFRPSRAIRHFCFVFPLSGLVAGIFGSTDPVAWPVLAFGGLAAGWTFRFLYDFESAPDASRLDGPLRALVGLWTLATILALIRARTLWALLHGLRGRTVNGEALPDTAAIRESLLTFAILAAGVGFFFVLRRSGGGAREECLRAALIGVAASAAVAIFQAIGLFPADTRPFWKLTGRHSGGATDPNALGLLCGIGMVVLLAHVIGRDRQRRAIGALLSLAVGLALSGSRSGFLVALLGGAAVIALAPIRGRLRVALALGGFVLAVGILLLPLSPGAVGGRVGQLFESALTLDDRTSSRPILWRAALGLFLEAPIEGGGLGSFAWRLPDLAGPDRSRLGFRDNPGSAYLQALAETGAIGLALTLLFVFPLAGNALFRARDPGRLGVAAALLAFLLVLAVGSHWLAPEVSLFFFLLCAVVAAEGREKGRLAARVRAVLVVLYGVAVLRAVVTTNDPAETFRHGKLAGFYDREAGTGGAFRWTRRRFAVRGGPEAPERILLANYSPEGRPVEVTVRADEGPVLFRSTLAAGGSTTLALWSGGRSRVFRFELSHAFLPKRFGLPDRRELGVVAVLPEDATGTSRD